MKIRDLQESAVSDKAAEVVVGMLIKKGFIKKNQEAKAIEVAQSVLEYYNVK